MSLLRPMTTINTLPDNIFIEIFNLCRTDEVDRTIWGIRPWKWYRLAHVCRTWRHIMFASSRRLHLELLCTHRTPVKNNIDHLPPFPIVISFVDPSFQHDNLFAALKHRDRVRVAEVDDVPCLLLEELATAMQEPFPALLHLRLKSNHFISTPTLPDSFLGGSAPRLQTIYMSGIAFPAAPTLLSSAHDLVDVNLSDIPPGGYIPPDVMVASLGTLPRLKYLTFGLCHSTSYPGPISLPLTRTILPALTTFYFDGLFEYFEYLVALIDAPKLCCLQIEYIEQDVTDFQIPQLCRFIDRSEKLQFSCAELIIQPYTVIIHLDQRGRSSFRLAIQEEVIGQVVNQISAMLSNVDRLLIGSEAMEGDDRPGYGIPWLELFWPFTAMKALSVDRTISGHILRVLDDVTGDRVAEVLPTVELLCLEYESVESMEDFVTARQNVGHPVTVVNQEMEFQERLKILDVSK